MPIECFEFPDLVYTQPTQQSSPILTILSLGVIVFVLVSILQPSICRQETPVMQPVATKAMHATQPAPAPTKEEPVPQKTAAPVGPAYDFLESTNVE